MVAAIKAVAENRLIKLPFSIGATDVHKALSEVVRLLKADLSLVEVQDNPGPSVRITLPIEVESFIQAVIAWFEAPEPTLVVTPGACGDRLIFTAELTEAGKELATERAKREQVPAISRPRSFLERFGGLG